VLLSVLQASFLSSLISPYLCSFLSFSLFVMCHIACSSVILWRLPVWTRSWWRVIIFWIWNLWSYSACSRPLVKYVIDIFNGSKYRPTPSSVLDCHVNMSSGNWLYPVLVFLIAFQRVLSNSFVELHFSDIYCRISIVHTIEFLPCFMKYSFIVLSMFCSLLAKCSEVKYRKLVDSHFKSAAFYYYRMWYFQEFMCIENNCKK
jgi:hypothetical protein